MKTLRILLCAAATLGTAAIFTACQSTPQGQKQTAAAGAKIDKLAAQISQVDAAIGTTVTALKVMQRKEMKDPQKILETFRSAVSTLDNAVAGADKTRESLEKGFAEYFSTWDAQLATVQDEELKAAAEGRRAEVSKTFEQAKSNAAEARAEFQTYYGKLKDLQTVLEMDYTPESIDALSPKIEEVISLAEQSRKSLGAVISRMQHIQSLTSAARMQRAS